MSSTDSNPYAPYTQLPGGESVTRGATAPDLLDGLRQRLDRAQRDLTATLNDVEVLAQLLARLAGETATVGQIPGPSAY